MSKCNAAPRGPALPPRLPVALAEETTSTSFPFAADLSLLFKIGFDGWRCGLGVQVA